MATYVEQHADGDSNAGAKGIVSLGDDGTLLQTIKTDSDGNLQVDVLTAPTTTVQATDLDIRNLLAADVVTVTGGAGQTADVKVTLDSESVAVTGSLTDTQLRAADVKITLDGEAATVAKTTAGTPAGKTVSTSAVELAESNANRLAIVITNNGAGDLYVGHSNAVTASGATVGLIVPSKGCYADSGFGLYTGALWGIYSAVAASQNVAVSERVA